MSTANHDEAKELEDEAATLPAKSATWLLVLGLVGLVPLWGIPFAAVAWWLGARKVRAIDAGAFHPSSRTKANIGRVLGKSVTIFWGVVIALFLIIGVIQLLTCPNRNCW